MSNVENGKLYTVGFGTECKEGEAYKGHTAMIFYSFHCEVLLTLNDIESLRWLTKKPQNKTKQKLSYLPNSQ